MPHFVLPLFIGRVVRPPTRGQQHAEIFLPYKSLIDIVLGRGAAAMHGEGLTARGLAVGKD